MPVLAARPIPGVIPVTEIKGGTQPSNNFKNNPQGGYLSHLDDIGQYTYPGGHGNQWGSTALVNDFATWDMPGDHFGQQHPTHSPHWDDGGRNDVWLETDEWIDYEVLAAAAGTYAITLRMASGQGPDPILPDQDPPRYAVRVDVDGQAGPGPMVVVWTGPGAYPVESAPSQYAGGPFGWSWIHHFFDVTSPGIRMSAGPHTLRVFMVRSKRGATWIEYLYVDRVADAPGLDGEPSVENEGGVLGALDSGSHSEASLGTSGGRMGKDNHLGGGAGVAASPQGAGGPNGAGGSGSDAASASSDSGCACSFGSRAKAPRAALLLFGAVGLCIKRRRRLSQRAARTRQ